MNMNRKIPIPRVKNPKMKIFNWYWNKKYFHLKYTRICLDESLQTIIIVIQSKLWDLTPELHNDKRATVTDGLYLWYGFLDEDHQWLNTDSVSLQQKITSAPCTLFSLIHLPYSAVFRCLKRIRTRMLMANPSLNQPEM